MMIGEVGVLPDAYFKLTRGETIAKANGMHINREYEALNARRIYSILYNVNVKKGKGKRENELWPLLIDDAKRSKLTDKEKERRKKIAKWD